MQLLKANFRLPVSSSHYEGNIICTYWEVKTEPDFATREHNKNSEKKAKLIEQVRQMKAEGYSMLGISRELGNLQ